MRKRQQPNKPASGNGNSLPQPALSYQHNPQPTVDTAVEAGEPKTFRAGFAGLIGKPNAGKSTLLNALVGQKLAIVTPRAQTTRDSILGIVSTDSMQAIFVDMPGIIKPQGMFNASLMDIASEAAAGADVLLHVVDANDPAPYTPEIIEFLSAIPQPRLLIFTQCDRLKRGASPAEPPPAIAHRYASRHAVSGTLGLGLSDLVTAIASHLPEHPPLFDPDTLTDRSVRYLAAETVREKVFLELQQELPYSIACIVEDFREPTPGQPTYIRVHILVERENQKRIVVGQAGQQLKRIGQAARTDIEQMLDGPVYLDLWVKVRPNWRRNEGDLRRLGYWVDGRSKRPGKH